MSRKVSYVGGGNKQVTTTNSDLLSHGGHKENTYDGYGSKRSEVHHTPDGKSHEHDRSGAIKK